MLQKMPGQVSKGCRQWRVYILFQICISNNFLLTRHSILLLLAAYMYFTGAKRSDIKEANPDASFGDIVSVIIERYICDFLLCELYFSHLALCMVNFWDFSGKACLRGVEET